MPEFVTLLATPAAILGLVTIAKDLGLPTKFASVLAVVIGVTLGLAESVFAASGAYQQAAQGALLALSAMGLYDMTQGTKPRRAEGEV